MPATPATTSAKKKAGKKPPAVGIDPEALLSALRTLKLKQIRAHKEMTIAKSQFPVRKTAHDKLRGEIEDMISDIAAKQNRLFA